MKTFKYLLVSILFYATSSLSGQGINWQSIDNSIDLGYRSVTYGNGIYVAVANNGSGKRVITSPDGINWTLRNTPLTNTWTSVTYGNGLFVAVASGGSTTEKVMTSPDGINWTSRVSAFNGTFTSVTHGNGTFVAVSSSTAGQQVMTSTDGITWSARTAAAANSWQSITYGNGLFVAVSITGSGNRVMTSPDGITWTSRASAGNMSWRSVTYGNGTFVAVANGGTENRVMSSTDGINWTSATHVGNNAWLAVTFGNGVFVAVSSNGTANQVMTSSDGATWTSRTTPADNSWNSITYGNGLFVAVSSTGLGNRVMHSPDGITWTNINTTPVAPWTSVAYGNGLFVAVSYANANSPIMTSTNGVQWSQKGIGTENYSNGITYGNGTFVAVGGGGTFKSVITSTDGANWITRTTPTTINWRSVTYGNGIFVAVSNTGTNQVMTSPDGITWTSRTAAENNSWLSVTYGNGLFVAVANSGTTSNRVMTSPDGINWTARATPSTNGWISVCYGDGLFVAVSSSGTNQVMTSPDGITWTARTAAADNFWYGLTYGNGLFVATSITGAGNGVMTSPDGITWTSRTSTADYSWRSVAYGNNRFVAICSNSTSDQVMLSTCLQPAVPAAISQNFCTSSNPTVNNLVATGQNLKWYSSETSTNALLSNDPLNTGTYFVTQTVDNCESDKTAVNITVNNCAITWTGAINNSWLNAGNWSTNVIPDGIIDVEISSGNPILDGSYTVGPTSSLTLTGTATLTIAPMASLTIQGTANFNNRSVTLQSDVTGTAVLGQVTGTINGATNFTVERYIPQGKRAFRFLSPGVTTTNFISNNWQLSTHITGSSTGANGFDTTATGSPSLFTYNNNQASGSGWSAIASTNTTNLEVGKGYRMLVRGDRNVNINASAAANMNAPVTLRATGTIATGTIIFNSSSATAVNNTNNSVTNGYSLIGNPYLNTIDWNAVNKIGLTDAYYVWDPNMGSASQRGRYVAYNSLSGSNNNASNVNQYIQPGQAFFIKNSDLGVPGILTFQETNKIGSNALSSIFRKQQNQKPRLDLSVYESNELSVGGFPLDAAATVFDATFTNEIDKADVTKLSTGIENLSFANNNGTWSIDARGPLTEKEELIVNLHDFQPNKNYTFRLQFTNVDSSLTPYLVDNFLGNSTAIAVNGATDISFTTTATAASFKNDRFKIVFQNKTLGTNDFDLEQIVLYPNPILNSQFNLTLPSTIEGDLKIQVINVLGQLVHQLDTTAKPIINVSLQQNLPEGVYFVKVTHKEINLTKKITIK